MPSGSLLFSALLADTAIPAFRLRFVIAKRGGTLRPIPCLRRQQSRSAPEEEFFHAFF